MTGATVQKTTGSFQVTSMEEDTYQPLDGGGKLTRARGDQRFSGDVQGDGHVEWLMCYRPDGSAKFVGHQLMRCSIDGRSGTFVIEANGEFDGGASEGAWQIVRGSGTGDLTGIQGEGGFEARSGPNASYHLDVAFG